MTRGNLLAGLALASLLLSVGGAARADDQDDATEWLLGFRIGGYGFRDVQGDAGGRWQDCRMNGLGVFGQRDFLGRHLHVEAGFDIYFATHRRDHNQGMDRVSGLLSAAVGGRIIPDAVVSPYAQLGTGLEITRVELEGLGSGTRTVPLAFLGIGADLQIHRFSAGLNIRANLMAQFPHDHEPGAPAHDHGGLPGTEMEVAAQMQFYAAYRL
jgi:hypothetical protein